ncbi:MAG: hypothetical protein WBZ31_04850 [Thiobacillus sp.]
MKGRLGRGAEDHADFTDLLRTPSNAFFPHRQWQYLTGFYLTEATCTFNVFQAKSEPLLSKAFGDFR